MGRLSLNDNYMEYIIKIKAEQIQILSAALGKLSFEIVAPLIADIQKQINEQEQEKTEG